MDKNNTQQFDNEIIVVLGMHRSGTSALAGCIAKLGAQTPSQLMPPTPDNPKGYWETFELMHIHDRLLESAGLDWSDVSPFPQAWYQTDSASLFKTEIQEFLATQSHKNQLFLIKDPRICRVPKLWFDLLKENNTRTHVVFSLRNPLEVAGSLASRDNMPIAIGCLLWLRHVLDAEQSSRKLSRSFVRYKDLISQPEEALSTVASDLDISWPSDHWNEVKKFMEPGLRHHSVNANKLATEKGLAAIINRTYQALDLLVDSPQNSSAMSSLDMIYLELEQCELLYEPSLTEKKQLVAKLKTQLTESKAALSELGSSYKLLTQQNQRQKEILSSRRKYIKVLEEEKSLLGIELAKLKHLYIQTYKQFTPLQSENQSIKNSKLSGIYSLLQALKNFSSRSRTRKEKEHLEDLIANSGLFDTQWYLDRYPDVSSSGISALEHFLEYGLEELRDPGPEFSTPYYIINNPDLISSGFHPLKHYILYGANEGRTSIPQQD